MAGEFEDGSLGVLPGCSGRSCGAEECWAAFLPRELDECAANDEVNLFCLQRGREITFSKAVFIRMSINFLHCKHGQHDSILGGCCIMFPGGVRSVMSENAQ